MSLFTRAPERQRPDAPAPGDRPAMTLAAIALGYLMIVLDATIVNVALPSIQTDLHFDRATLAWVFNAYLLAFGGLLLLGGRIGDIYGRRRAFTVGVAVFTLASLLGGLATSAAWLVSTRVVQGVGAAMIAPNTLALLAANFPEGPRRTRALSVYATVALTGGSIGLFLGGLITTWASWRWVMLVVVPVGAVVVLIVPRVLAETQRRPGRFDLPGALTSTLGMASLVYGLITAGADGWTSGVWAMLVFGGVLLTAFAAIEQRAGQPIVPLRLFAERHRAGSYLNLMLLTGAMFGTFFLLTQYLQDVRGFGPFMAGLAFLPQTFSAIVAVRLVPRAISRFGTRVPMLAGGALAAIAMVGFSRLSPSSTYLPDLVVPMMLLGLGIGSSVLPLNLTILAGITNEDAGAASSVASAMQWVGGSLGISVLVSAFGAATRGAASAGASSVAVFSLGASSAFSVAVGFIVAALVVVALVIRVPGSARRVAPATGDPARRDAPHVELA